jgi:hypothetical protein
MCVLQMNSWEQWKNIRIYVIYNVERKMKEVEKGG